MLRTHLGLAFAEADPMRKILGFFLVFSLFLAPSTQTALAASRCESVFTATPSRFQSKKFHEVALKIMLDGSLNVSRTKVLSRRFMAPKDLEKNEISKIAEDNFKTAAEYVLLNYENLPINLDTAVFLNKILTKGLVPENVRGKYNYRPPVKKDEMDGFIGQTAEDFYVHWLNSSMAQTMLRTSPFKLAEIVHNTIICLDSFPDGNGRLSRLLADLVLLKGNLAPAYYTSMTDYFARGTPHAGVPRDVRQEYFYEITRKGLSTVVYQGALNP